jgi:hypothetical protein
MDITKDEMSEIVDATTDPDFKNALKGIKLVGDSKTLLTLDNTETTNYRKALVVYGRRTDGKYDVLVVYATQLKELAVDKLVACSLGSVCARGVGIGTAVVIWASSGAKAAYDYTTDMPDVVCGLS